MHFLEKARGWELIAVGVFLFALDATWGVWTIYGWPVATFMAAVVARSIAAAMNTTLRVRHAHRVLAEHGPGG